MPSNNTRNTRQMRKAMAGPSEEPHNASRPTAAKLRKSQPKKADPGSSRSRKGKARETSDGQDESHRDAAYELDNLASTGPPATKRSEADEDSSAPNPARPEITKSSNKILPITNTTVAVMALILPLVFNVGMWIGQKRGNEIARESYEVAMKNFDLSFWGMCEDHEVGGCAQSSSRHQRLTHACRLSKKQRYAAKFSRNFPQQNLLVVISYHRTTLKII